jgi:hypothetical protein
VPERTLNVVLTGLPYLQERVASYGAYANMSVQEIFGAGLAKAAVLQANTFESMIFTLRDGKFQGEPLPAEAQFAPAFGVCVGDLDGDGYEDIVLSQNDFALAPSEPRCDAGRGLWLRGDGHGHFTAVPGQQSGIRIYGEQRGCALSDFDGDGRIDLAIGQNGNAIKVLHNVGGRPALRIRLKGPSGNPNAVGALCRLEAGGVKGAIREVQAGSGYWSQNSAVQVMALPGGRGPSKLWVQWPGGKTTLADIPLGAQEIETGQAGEIRVLR